MNQPPADGNFCCLFFTAPGCSQRHVNSRNSGPKTARCCFPSWITEWKISAPPSSYSFWTQSRSVGTALEKDHRGTHTPEPTSGSLPLKSWPYPAGWLEQKFLRLIHTFYSLSENPIISNSCVSSKDMNFV